MICLTTAIILLVRDKTRVILKKLVNVTRTKPKGRCQLHGRKELFKCDHLLLINYVCCPRGNASIQDIIFDVGLRSHKMLCECRFPAATTSNSAYRACVHPYVYADISMIRMASLFTSHLHITAWQHEKLVQH